MEANIRPNSHFWAIYKGTMAVFYRAKDKSIYIAGATGSEYTEQELTFVEYIYNPKSNIELYFETYCN